MMQKYQRKIRNKLLAIGIIVALIAPIFAYRVMALSTTFILQPNQSMVKRGDTVTVVIGTQNLSEVSGGFNGYSGTLGYDSSVLSRSKSETMVSGWNFVYNPSANTFLGNDPTGMDFKKTDLNFFSITFEVLSNAPLGETTVSLSKLAISDASYKNISLPNASVKITVVEDSAPPEPSKSSNSNLSGITVGNQTLSPSFNPTTTNYSVTVGNGVSSLNIGATTQDGAATIVSGTGSHSLAVGQNRISIVVRAEDGSTKTYVINVTREDASDNGNNDGDGSGNGNDNGSDTGSGNGSDNGTGTDNGNGTGNNGGNDTGNSNNNGNQNGNTNNNSNSTGDIIVNNNSSNNYVIDVQGFGNMDRAFDKNVYHYVTYIGRDVSSVYPVVILEDEGATYRLIGGENLLFGSNEVILQVTASNGEVKEYVFEVIRSESDNNSLLANLNVGGYAINPGFREDVNYYSLTVSSEVSSLGVTATPKFGGASVNVTGHDTLNYGANFIKVSVTGVLGMNTYIVEVIREVEPEPFNVLPWVIAGVSLLLVLILSIALYYNRKIDRLMESRRNERFAQRQIEPYYNAPQTGVNQILGQPGVRGVTKEYHFFQDVEENGKMVTKRFKIVEEGEKNT